MRPSSHRKAGFTLIELLVVIAIVGILASVVLAGLSSTRTGAQKTRATAEMRKLVEMMFFAKLNSGQTLMQITGTGCSHCAGCADIDLRSTSGACYTRWVTSLTNVEAALQGTYGSLTRYHRDPWGSPYLLDENEGEQPADPCRIDRLRSAGPDGIMSTADDTSLVLAIPNILPGCQ